MAVLSTANAEWKGALKEGSGQMRFGGGAYHGDYTWAGRFETGKGTNPEELLAAAHAGCFSMQLSGVLTGAGTPPKSIRTKATVTMVHGTGITRIELSTEADVPGITETTLIAAAEKAKEICPVSKALAAVKDIAVTAKLVAA
ncbi:MAG: OsmC family peroxiredoxin [Cucumibacter sp.]